MTRNTSKNISTLGESSLSVSPDIKAILPGVLIEYLWKLALCEDWQGYERQLFTLEATKLSGQNIQEIYHICNYSNLMDKRRVYGVEPINCKLQVLNSHGSYQMQLCEYV